MVGKLQGSLTYATAIPPMPIPSVDFLQGSQHQDTSTWSLPVAHTCITCLHLPFHSSIAVYKDKMDCPISNPHGFGRA